MRYTIDYGLGITRTVEGDLDKAKEEAVKGMSYSQRNVRILDEDGTEVAVSYWYGVKPGEDDAMLVQFGDFGFYAEWQPGN